MFCPAAIQPNTSVYNAFYTINTVIPPIPQNNAQGFTGAFPAICLVLPPLCGGVSCYTAPPATRWSVSQRRNTSSAYPDTSATPYAVQVSTDRPIIIRYIRVRPCYGSMPDSAAYRRPCKPGGGLDASHARRLAIWHRSAVRAYRVSPAHSTRRGSPAAGAWRAARNHWRLAPQLFSGFRPIANRGRQ